VRGALRPGDTLPPSREMARTLSVSRMTVTVAYERLTSEGFTTSRARAGTFVNGAVTHLRGRPELHTDDALRPRRVWQSIDLPAPFTNPPEFNFRTGVPDPSLLPHQAWRRIVGRVLRANATAVSSYSDPSGLPELRETIARHVAVSRGVQASADDIIVTNGTQQALDMLTRVLLDPGDGIAMEDPGYPPARRLFESVGVSVHGVRVDEEGLVVDGIPRRVRTVYVTPSHQYPLGVAMTLRRRRALLAWAQRHSAAVIEDDYDSEFRFGGRPLEPLRTLDTDGHVIYVGSFSKTLLPGARLGFIAAPRSLRSALHKAKSVADWHTPTLEQLALARFIDDGAFARHIRKVNRVYHQRHDLILNILRRDFADHLEPIPSDTGLHVSAVARKASVQQIATIAERARAVGVAIQVLAFFSVSDKPRSGIVLGYGGVPTARIEEGLHRLRKCFTPR
jgi:GntR family transcriptional regulator/MocR family aminotransferase